MPHGSAVQCSGCRAVIGFRFDAYRLHAIYCFTCQERVGRNLDMLENAFAQLRAPTSSGVQAVPAASLE